MAILLSVMKCRLLVNVFVLLHYLAITTCIAEQDCAALVFNSMTKVTPSSPTNLLGETLKVTCPAGYAFDQSSHADDPYVLLSCLSNGWNASQTPNCAKLFTSTQEVEAPCSPLLDTSVPLVAGNRTLVLGNGTSYGSIYRYYCASGFRLVGTPIVQCRDGWQGFGNNLAEPSCERTKCKLPSHPALRLSLSSPDPYFGSTVDSLTSIDVNCAIGYIKRSPSGDSSRCMPDGTFDAPPLCEDIDECVTLDSACDLNQTCYNYDGGFRCECKEDYEFDPADSKTCKDINECETTPDLCPLGTCENLIGAGYRCVCDGSAGLVLYTHEGAQGHLVPKKEVGIDNVNVTFRLNHTCVLRECVLPSGQPTDGQILGKESTYHVRDQIGFVCDLGYLLVGGAAVTCESDGNWSADIPKCETAFCTLRLDHLNKASYKSSSGGETLTTGLQVPYGSVLEVSCTGQSNGSRRQCVYNREKDAYTLGIDDPFTCQAVTCEPAHTDVDIGNGTLQPTGGEVDKFGSRYDIVCSEGSNAVGTTGLDAGNVSECGDNGAWTLGSAYCQRNYSRCSYTKSENVKFAGSTLLDSIGTKDECQAECTMVAECAAYEWNRVTSECFTFISVNDTDFIQQTTNDFYEKVCVQAMDKSMTTAPVWAPDACHSGPCLNAGTCSKDGDGYSCNCESGYTDDDCSKNTACLSADTTCPHCIPNDRDGGRLCVCTGLLKPDPGVTRSGEWWAGYPAVSPTCVASDPCDADPCQNMVQCTAATDQDDQATQAELYTCACTTGLEGENCQVSTNECKNHPCMNGGTCIDMDNAYTCRCVNSTGYYYGPQCNLGCDTNPCDASGTMDSGCVNLLTDYHCPCKQGYEGNNCQLETNLCASNPCSSGALSCSRGLNTFSCSCGSGWQGPLCDQLVSKCSPASCRGDAPCYDLFNDYFCMCASGPADDSCDRRVTSCNTEDRCYGHDSTCVDNVINDTFSCNCGQGLGGANCFLEEDKCVEVCETNVFCPVEALGKLVCGARGEQFKQLVINKTLSYSWNDETSVSRTCSTECEKIKTGLSEKLGPIRYLGTAPVDGSTSSLILDHLGFPSQLAHIKTEIQQLGITVTPNDKGKISLANVRPLIGPAAGGTRLTITGYNIPSQSKVLIGSADCPIIKRNSVVLICNTIKANEGQEKGIYVTIGDLAIYARLAFKYGADPVIRGVYPLATIISGGTSIHVNGLNLKSVFRILLLTKVVDNDNNGKVYTYETVCMVASDTKMVCPTANITNVFTVSSRRKKRHADITSHVRRRRTVVDKDISITIGFKLDGVTSYEDLSSNTDTNKFGTIAAFKDPKVSKFKGPEETVTFKRNWPFREKTIEIQGEDFVPGKFDFVKVLIGEGICRVTDHTSTEITCEPPSQPPQAKFGKTHPTKGIPVTVVIGNLHFDIGHIIYILHVWDYLPARYAMIACSLIVALILIVCSCCCWFRKKKFKKKVKTVLKRKNFINYLPRATRQNFMRPGSISNQLGFADSEYYF